MSARESENPHSTTRRCVTLESSLHDLPPLILSVAAIKQGGNV